MSRAVKLASGWMHPEFPGRVFADKKALMVVLAYNQPLPPGILAPQVQEALKKGTYGESPIQALVDSEKFWNSNGDPSKAAACRAEIDKRQGQPSEAAPAPAPAPKVPSKLTTQPSKKTKGWTMFYLDGSPLIELPPDMVAKFTSDYEQAQGDEELEADVWEQAKKATEALRPKESEPAGPSGHMKIKPTGGDGEDEDYEVQTSYGGTAKAYMRVTLLDAKNPDGSVKIDPKTKKPVKFRIHRKGIEVYSPDGEMVSRYALTEKTGNIPSQMTRLVGQPESTKLPGTTGEKYESFSKIELQKDETGEYITDPRSGKTKQRTVGELTPVEMARELKNFVKPQDLSGLFAHIGLVVPGLSASTKVVVKVAMPTKVLVRVANPLRTMNSIDTTVPGEEDDELEAQQTKLDPEIQRIIDAGWGTVHPGGQVVLHGPQNQAMANKHHLSWSLHKPGEDPYYKRNPNPSAQPSQSSNPTQEQFRVKTTDPKLDWAKGRAIDYLNKGDLNNAVASFASDAGKADKSIVGHEMWRPLFWDAKSKAEKGDAKGVADWINGF